MALTSGEMTPADIAAVTGNNGNRGNAGWGDGGAWWIIILFLFVFCGWGNNGFGGNNGGGTSTQGYDTRADLQRGFDNQAVITKLDGLSHGLCDSTYALNNSITGGFSAAELSRCNQQAALMQQLFAMQAAQQQCCCETQRSIDSVNYNMATQACDTRNLIQSSMCGLQNTMNTNTRDIIDNANANSRAILDFLTQDKIASLTAENQSLKFQASQTAQNAFINANQDAQTAELIRRLGRDCPVPAYVVPNPNCCYGTPVGVMNNGGCGQCC